MPIYEPTKTMEWAKEGATQYVALSAAVIVFGFEILDDVELQWWAKVAFTLAMVALFVAASYGVRLYFWVMAFVNRKELLAGGETDAATVAEANRTIEAGKAIIPRYQKHGRWAFVIGVGLFGLVTLARLWQPDKPKSAANIAIELPSTGLVLVDDQGRRWQVSRAKDGSVIATPSANSGSTFR